MQIRIPKGELHLAAYIKAAGAQSVDYKQGSFIFEGEITEVELS